MFEKLFTTKTKYRTYFFKSSVSSVLYQVYVQANETYVSTFIPHLSEWKPVITTEGWPYMTDKEMTAILEDVDKLYA